MRALISLVAVLLVTLGGVGPVGAADGPAVPVIKGVQTGTVVFGNAAGQSNAASAAVTLGLAVDATKAFVHCSFSTNQPNSITRPTCELSDTTVTITLAASVASSAHTTVRWYVAEFESGVSVQRGLATFTTTGADGGTASAEPLSAVVTLGTSVSCTSSFVLTTERINLASATADEQWQAGATLVTTSAGSAPRSVCTSGSTTFLELSGRRTPRAARP